LYQTNNGVAREIKHDTIERDDRRITVVNGFVTVRAYDVKVLREIGVAVHNPPLMAVATTNHPWQYFVSSGDGSCDFD
jgi:hypothetical protein